MIKKKNSKEKNKLQAKARCNAARKQASVERRGEVVDKVIGETSEKEGRQQKG